MPPILFKMYYFKLASSFGSVLVARHHIETLLYFQQKFEGAFGTFVLINITKITFSVLMGHQDTLTAVLSLIIAQ